MTTVPLVSVIIPNYNHAKYLRSRIDSILEQTFQDFELIILDDCSSDESLAILELYEEHPKVSRFIKNEINSGSPFKQWQKGIMAAKGSYIWIAESDDIANQDFLANTVPILNNNPMTSLVYTDSDIIDSKGNLIGNWREKKNAIFKTDRWSQSYSNFGLNELIYYLLYRVTINNVSAVLFRGKVLDQVNFGMLNSLTNTGDLFVYASALIDTKIQYISTPLNQYRKHESNLTHKNTISGEFFRDALRCYEYILELISHRDLNPNELAQLTKVYCFMLQRFGFNLVNNGKIATLKNIIYKCADKDLFTVNEARRIYLWFKIYDLCLNPFKYRIKKYIKNQLRK